MKKWLVLCCVLVIGIILVACGSKEVETTQTNSKSVFSAEDIKKAEEMIIFLDSKLKEFEKETNSLIQNGSINTDDEDIFDKEVKELGKELVTNPFIEKYKGSVIPEEFKDKEQIHIYFNMTSSEPCSLNFCEYDGIEVMSMEYSFKKYKEYQSINFPNTELIFENVSYDYKNDKEEAKEAVISFVKDKRGNLIFTQHPSISFTTLNFQVYDKDLESIKTDVPESEVDAEQAEYKEEVQETLEKFPELQ